MDYNYLKIENKVAIVTGGGRGIGQAISKALAQFGAKVIIADINDEWGLMTMEEIKQNGGEAIFVHCDMTNFADIENVVAKTLETFGTVDILVNDAGMGDLPLPCEEINVDQWEKMMKLNLTAPFYITKLVMPIMKNNRYGKIINISSGSGVIGCEFCSHYAASKAGLIGFTQSIAKEVAALGITANAIATPTTNTPMIVENDLEGRDWDTYLKEETRDIPAGRIAEPEDISNMVLYLASDVSAYVTGQVLAPNGGRRTPM